MLRKLVPMTLLLVVAGCSGPVPRIDLWEDTAPPLAGGTPVPDAPPSSAPPSSKPPSSAPPVQGYVTYHNRRLGFSLPVPAAFTAGDPLAGDAGLSWSGEGARLLAFGTPTPPGDSAAARLTQCVAGLARVTYKFRQGRDFACSGFRADGQISYQWGTVGKTNEYTLVWLYPQSLLDNFRQDVELSVKSFEPGPL